MTGFDEEPAGVDNTKFIAVIAFCIGIVVMAAICTVVHR